MHRFLFDILYRYISFTGDSNVKYRQDDAYLLRYLRVRKYDVKKAYNNIRMFYEQRKKYPEFFTIPEDLKSIQKLNWYTILPYADEEGRPITLLNFGKKTFPFFSFFLFLFQF